MRAKDCCPPRKPVTKIVWSWIGAFAGIYILALFASWSGVSVLLLGSFGASAVLVYGVPMAELAQPRNLVGGHLVSAIVGVTCYQLMSEHPELASALAVSLAIASMHMTRTLHPPGGATALIAVIGGESVHELGYFYVISPVLLGCFVILLIGLVVNNLSTKADRHYPVYWV